MIKSVLLIVFVKPSRAPFLILSIPKKSVTDKAIDKTQSKLVNFLFLRDLKVRKLNMAVDLRQGNSAVKISFQALIM